MKPSWSPDDRECKLTRVDCNCVSRFAGYENFFPVFQNNLTGCHMHLSGTDSHVKWSVLLPIFHVGIRSSVEKQLHYLHQQIACFNFHHVHHKHLTRFWLTVGLL